MGFDWKAETMSDRQLAGQRLMVGFAGTGLNDALKYLIDGLKVGGLVLFAINLESPGQIRDLCGAAQDYARGCGQAPLLIAVDQEGGTVARLKPPHFTAFDGNPHLRTTGDADRFARITADELQSVGLNMNLAPVLDLAVGGNQSIMAKRAFGPHPYQTAQLGRAVIQGLQSRGIMAVAKHFPGIGRTVLDSHLDLPVLDAPLDILESADLLPFEAAIKAEVAGVMLSHILYRRIDPHWPASLSVSIARDLLQKRMGYQGLVLTDDLDMGAVKKHYPIETAMARILAADIDLALICHQGPDIQKGFDAISDRIANSDRLRQRAILSAKKIINYKSLFMDSEK